MADKIYCGNGKKITTRYGDMMRLSISESDLQALQDNLENGWVNVKVCERREPSQSGMTHYLEVDTWKPNQDRDGGNDAPAAKPTPAQTEEVSAEDLPF
jgi:hypothetical protein